MLFFIASNDEFVFLFIKNFLRVFYNDDVFLKFREIVENFKYFFCN